MVTETEEMTLRDYASVVARRRWVVIGAVLICAIAALALTLTQTPVYSATSEVQVEPRNEILGAGISAQTVETEIQLMGSQEVRDQVQHALGLTEPPPDLDTTDVEDEINVISLTVEDSDADSAERYAVAYANAYIEVRRERDAEERSAATTILQAAIDDLRADIDNLSRTDLSRDVLVPQLVDLTSTLRQLTLDDAVSNRGPEILDEADVSAEQVKPAPIRNVILAVVIGLLLGLGAAFLLDYLDDKLRTEDDLAKLVALPVLATVAVDPPPDRRPIAVSEPRHNSVETYRGLRANLQFRGVNRKERVTQVTSCSAGEGATTTAVNLAVVLAQAGHRVALVDANLRHPQVHEMFAVAQSPGFTDLLLDTNANDVANTVALDDTSTLSVFASGLVPSNPGDLLSGQRCSELLEELGTRFDFVIVDSAPVLAVSDAVTLSRAADALLLVVQAGRTTGTQLTEALGRLQQADAPVAGLVLNRAAVIARDVHSYG